VAQHGTTHHHQHGQDSDLVTRQTIWRATAGIIGLLGIVIGSLTLAPQLFYPPLSDAELQAVPSAEARIQLKQAQAQLQNNVRSTLLQLTAGLLVIAGAAATWRQVNVNREGQITERFTRAIEQVGSDNVDVRIGAIYALERIAKNSPTDRNTVQFILGAFVRNHAPWHVGAPDGPDHPTPTIEDRPWLQILAPDIQAAVGVLSRRHPFPNARGKFPEPRSAYPDGAKLYLSRVDLRGLQLYRARLINTQLRYANLARSWLQGTWLNRSDLKSADLRRSHLQETSFVDANLNFAYLSGANLQDADLRGADLRGADLRDANLTGVVFEGALADAATIWPAGFDDERLREAGVRLAAVDAATVDP
jgi:hypothetical protein